jgi:hypothetical protein
MEVKKLVTFKLDGLKIIISIDGDQDGQPSVVGQIDLSEVIAEALGMVKK